METLQAVWKKVNSSEYFTYMDVYEVFMQRNRRTTDMANLLLMYFHHQHLPDLLRPVRNGFVRD